jgi:uncharacterized SAM-binding protein YcdF (DUF218 family)
MAASRPLLSSYALLFRVNNPAPSDALVLLMGDKLCERTVRAAELFHDGLAPRILVGTNGGTRYVCRDLRSEGVPASAVTVMPGEVTSTRDEALRTREALKSLKRVRRITVVTTAFHTARAYWIFRKVLQGTGVEVRMAAAEQPRYTERNWYWSRMGLCDYLEESIKTVYYHLVY